jgi:hypothetical protein
VIDYRRPVAHFPLAHDIGKIRTEHVSEKGRYRLRARFAKLVEFTNEKQHAPATRVPCRTAAGNLSLIPLRLLLLEEQLKEQSSAGTGDVAFHPF